MYIAKRYTNLEVHISTQQSLANSLSVKFFNEKVNVERCVLARELSVNDIKTVVDLDAFKSARQVRKQANTERPHSKSIEQIEYVIDARGQKNILPKTIKSVNQTKNKTYINSEYIDNLIRLFM